MKFSPEEIAEYYDSTRFHYEKWWRLRENYALHYGIWDEQTKSFSQALRNTDRIMSDAGRISASDRVLDAGCGIGGSALYVAKHTGAFVTGISLSRKQISSAIDIAEHEGLSDQVRFEVMDYTATTFPDSSFDVVWACESVCHVADKNDFIKEAYRLLKTGGRLVLCDFFLADDMQPDKHHYIDKWIATWGVPGLVNSEFFAQKLKNSGFRDIETTEYTQHIRKSSYRLFLASLLGAFPSVLYNLFHPNVSRFARSHYKCGYYQYKALQVSLWRYKFIMAVK